MNGIFMGPDDAPPTLAQLKREAGDLPLTLGTPPDYSELTKGEEKFAPVVARVGDEVAVRIGDDVLVGQSARDYLAKLEAYGSTVETFLPIQRPFVPSHNLADALDEGRLTRAAWGTMELGHPIVVAALSEAETNERRRHELGVGWRYLCVHCCSADAIDSVIAPFPWAGALFVHLLTCPHFAKTVDP